MALPGEMIASYWTMPTSVKSREPASAFTLTVSPTAKPSSAAVTLSITISVGPAGRRPSMTFHRLSSPVLTVAPNVGAVGRSSG